MVGQDMAALLQQALQKGSGQMAPQASQGFAPQPGPFGQPQNTEQIDPMQPDVFGPEEPMVDPVTEIQEQLDAVMQALDQTQDPMELQQLAGVARELQIALEAALQQELGPTGSFGPMDTAEDELGIENY